MKKAIIISLFVLMKSTGFSQEFGKSTNGLIYSDTTVKQLKYIFDSLNLKFKICDFSKVYKSKLQAKGHFISLEKSRIKEAKKDMEANMPYDEFINNYNPAKVEKDLLIVKYKYKNYSDENVVEFSSLELGDKSDHELSFDKNLSSFDKPLKGKWLYKYYDKSKYSEESIQGFYITEEFTSKPLPERYARMIQYSECMVDTSTQIFYDKAQRSGVRYDNDESVKVGKFMDYIHKATREPVYDKNDYETYQKNYELWDSLRYILMDSLKNNDKNFNPLLISAINEAKEKGGTGDEFEEFVGRYYSRKTELELKRNRIVVGGCSMDNSPRVHALNIAKLSAETIHWEIFLRSHLDIMNDNFQRVSDGSYAWERRKTYIKELEILDINVLDLLLGISLRVENPSKNHYFGNIGRIGRALSESNQAAEIETKMLEMISDNELDDYNRIVIYNLFQNYNYNLENKEHQAKNTEKLKTAIKALPDYLSSKISL